MERVLSHIPKQHCIVYLDDLLVHAGYFEGALRHLREVFAAICCRQLFRRETTFLGHVVSADGVATDPAKIAAVRDWPPPTNISDLQSFLGLASYYRRYVQDFATIARPLHHLTDRGQPYVWDDPCAQAFNVLQTALITAPVLACPDTNRPFILDTDASNVGVGAVLSQPIDSGEQVQEEQERDAALTQVRSWLVAGKRPDVAALDTETRAYHSQWAGLDIGWPHTDPWHSPLPRRQVSHPDPFPPETLSERLGEAGGEPRGGGVRRHI
ncbi:hypothetical protein AAFF_G00166400 [Aldrovandia affinis]|uniref:Reverse transcriptase/retrotransposon-derived protein RNase H-like domain-containing protein n=1 Tax=Aldrovandia affinis TaxID=143900 RepID=A0AAD7RML2_9TELE|nr:hypothetical protein AAFF_G00166400 [Aldrovandia affinis]